MRRIAVIVLALALAVSAWSTTQSFGAAAPTLTPTQADKRFVDRTLNSLCGRIDDSRTVRHPSLGTATVGLRRLSGSQTGHGCVAASGPAGQKLLVQQEYVYGNELSFASPALDATSNVFVIYNPGRYNGVMTLVPNTSGYQDIGWGSADRPFRDTTHAYYWVELLGPGADGRYAIKQYDNTCEPNYAGGQVTTKILRWNGQRYT